jgi:hypothetical protein
MARTRGQVSPKNVDWRILYGAAVCETAPKRLLTKLNRAQTAISKRLQQLDDSRKNAAERQTLRDALQNLRALRESLPKSAGRRKRSKPTP